MVVSIIDKKSMGFTNKNIHFCCVRTNYNFLCLNVGQKFTFHSLRFLRKILVNFFLTF